MPGGLIQLTAYGKEDAYLTGNPNLSYFKKVFKRHTNFVMELLDQTFLYFDIHQLQLHQNLNSSRLS